MDWFLYDNGPRHERVTGCFEINRLIRMFKIQIFQILTLTLSIPEKFKNSIFEIPIIPQTLNINNWRTASANSINLDIIRKLIDF